MCSQMLSKVNNKTQFLAIQMLATGMSGKEVAKNLGISPITISRWNQLPQFRTSLNRTLDEIKLAAGKKW